MLTKYLAIPAAIAGMVGALLLMLTLYGVVNPDDRRWVYELEHDYQSALTAMDRAFAKHGAGFEFVSRATDTYAGAIHYEWPLVHTRVSPWDNWILFSMAWVDPLFVHLGLTDNTTLFRHFQSQDYTRGFRRGFGICSQNAIAFADLLQRRYGLDSNVVGLEGHVVLQVSHAEGSTLHDPSLGLSFAQGYADLGETVSPAIVQAYAATSYPELAFFYDPPGNVLEPDGARGYRPKVYLLERFSDVAKWLVPVLLIVLGLVLGRYARRRVLQ